MILACKCPVPCCAAWFVCKSVCKVGWGLFFGPKRRSAFDLGASILCSYVVQHHDVYAKHKAGFHTATRPSARSLALWHPHGDRLGQRLRLYLSALYSGGGKGGRPQLSSGGEVAYTRAHSSAAGWSMESPEREELSGALLAFDGEAHPHPLQEVPDASAPP
jgi:hypothetical protein